MSVRPHLVLLLIWIAISIAGCSIQPNNAINPTVTSITGSPGTPASSISTSQPPQPNINPLTGQTVQEAGLLNLPAVLISISHFPVTARPQAGLSFAPFVYEVYITEGATRFLTTFYGEFPSPENPLTGHCSIRTEPIKKTDLLIGNRVWFDENKNNQQDDWERGIGGICINLYDKNLVLIEQTSTDSNGYYAFNVPAGEYYLAFDKADMTEFAQMNVGDEEKDSDLNPESGYIEAVTVNDSRLNLDVGLIPSENYQRPYTSTPEQVGPVRSGRLVYADIANSFKGSCLIFAYASSEVLSELPKCSFVDHIIQGGGYMLEVSQMVELANDRKDTKTPANYTGNIFAAEPPKGGLPASQLHVYIAWLNQSAWTYDDASQTYWRYVDDADELTAGILHPEIDRLNKRQLQFENVIVIHAVHDVISPTNLDIHLEVGRSGDAYLFRDGYVYEIRWAVEKGKPMQFFYKHGGTFPLKPGHTWVTVVTPETTVSENKPGQWTLQFKQPEGAK